MYNISDHPKYFSQIPKKTVHKNAKNVTAILFTFHRAFYLTIRRKGVAELTVAQRKQERVNDCTSQPYNIMYFKAINVINHEKSTSQKRALCAIAIARSFSIGDCSHRQDFPPILVIR